MGILNLFDLLRKVLFLRKLNEQEKRIVFSVLKII